MTSEIRLRFGARSRLPLLVVLSLALHIILFVVLSRAPQSPAVEKTAIQPLSFNIHLTEKFSGTGAYGLPEPEAVEAEPAPERVEVRPEPAQPVQQKILQAEKPSTPEAKSKLAEAEQHPDRVHQVVQGSETKSVVSQAAVTSEKAIKSVTPPAEKLQPAAQPPAPPVIAEVPKTKVEQPPEDVSVDTASASLEPAIARASETLQPPSQRPIPEIPKQYAGMQMLDDEALAQVHSPTDSNNPEAARWRSIRFYLERLEKHIYQAWNGVGKWPGNLGGVIRFELDEEGGLQKVYVHLSSGRQDFDQSILKAVQLAIHPFTEDTQQLAQLNYRYFRFYYNSVGRVSRPKELMPWEREDLAAGNLEYSTGS